MVRSGRECKPSRVGEAEKTQRQSESEGRLHRFLALAITFGARLSFTLTSRTSVSACLVGSIPAILGDKRNHYATRP